MAPMEIVIEVVVGVVVGLVLGMLGAGGGIISVPALVFLLDQPPAVATTTSLVIIGTTGVFAVAQHGRAGNVAWADGIAFGVLGAGGALLGSRVATVAEPHLTLGLFAVLLVVTAAVMWHRSGTDGRTDPAERARDRWLTWRPFSVDLRRLMLVLVVASAVGVLTGFFGVGGGFALVPALILVLGMPMSLAVGTSLLVITLNSVTGVAGRLGTDLRLDWQLILVFTAAAVVSSLVGGRVGRQLDAALLQRGFAVMLVLVAGYTATSTFLL
ncbi:MAG: sulfite exporter TauE/SafE family protein [Acidobacteria bacterium]|nr:MAG: sulfite exporter TauE/SafE family protein [Acidobacteriota bacterium]